MIRNDRGAYKTRIFSGAVLALLFISFFFLLDRKIPAGPALKISEHHDLKLDRSYVFLDQFAFNFDGEIYIFTAYFTNSFAPEVQASLPFYITAFNPVTKKIGKHQRFLGLEHVRDIQKVKTPWGEGVLIADHGFDHISHGGFLRLLIFDPKDKNFIDMSDKLPFKERIYAFNIATLKNELGLDDIIVAIVNMENTSPLYLMATDSNYIDRSDLLPMEWRTGQNCYMTASQIEITQDQSGIYLGACDRDPSTKNTSRDRVIVNNQFIDARFIPDRNDDYTWGTVFIHKANLTKDQLHDLVILTHDFGFNKGDIRIFTRKNTNFEPLPIKGLSNQNFNKKGQHYFHSVTSFDLDKDGQEDIIATIRYLSERNPGEFKTHFSLMNNGDHFQFVNTGVEIPSSSEIVSIQTIILDDQKQLMIFFHDGSFALYK